VKKTTTFLLAIGLASCAPKADIVEEAALANTAPTPLHAQTGLADLSPKETKPTLPVVRNTGLRLPDMLDLPKDEQLRTAPGATNDGKATVIARPPEE
jgi:hypothetical protein